MDYEKLQKYLGTEDMSVVEAMQKIDMNSKGIIYIADERGKLLGSLTDGDIRRWLIKTADLNGRASETTIKKPKSLPGGGQLIPYLLWILTTGFWTL